MIIDSGVIFSSCFIKPLDLEGKIVGIFLHQKVLEFQIRYYWNGEQKTEFFYDWEVEVYE